MESEMYLTMDAKRRISIPTKCRKELGGSVVITRHLDGCLNVFPETLWKKGETKVQEIDKQLSITEKHRKLSRFLTTAYQVSLDTSGRMVIPEHLAEFAGLKDTVVFVGTSEGFEVWSGEQWKSEGMMSIETAQKIAESGEFQSLRNKTL